MANKTVYPYGTGGQLPDSIGLINDLVTGGVDKALTAEQGKIIGQRLDAIEQGGQDEDGSAPFDMNSRRIVHGYYPVTTYQGWYIKPDKTWGYAGGNHNTCVLIPLVQGQEYKVYGNTTGSTIALLKSNSMTSGSVADFCTGNEGLITVSANDVYSFVPPQDAAYIYVRTKVSDASRDAYVRTLDINPVGVIPRLLDDITKINAQPIDVISLTPTNGRYINDSTNKWAANNTHPEYYEMYFIPVTAGNTYILLGNTTGGRFAILKNKTVTVSSTPGFSDYYPMEMVLQANRVISIVAPDDANYICIWTVYNNAEKDCCVAIPKHITDQVKEAGSEKEAEEKDKFETAPEYYAWLKSQQMATLKWTPLKPVPQSSSTATFPANTEQTGILYSSVAEYDKRVGQDVSFHTFMTAVHNPYSLLYTENVRYDYSQSAYGRRYYGAKNSGAYYGVVCSGFTSYALDTIPYPTGVMDDLAEAGIMEVVYDQSANGVKRCDILWMEGHVMMVKEVWRKNGVVTRVQICEGYEPRARNRSIMTATTFNSFLASNSIIIYRYKELYKNTKYTPSPYVQVGGEEPQTVTYNDDICTFAGDKAAFREGELIYIHCLNLNYPQMEIYKDDVLLETITLADDARASLTSDELAYAVNLSNDNLTYGMYKCRLKNGSTYSAYTYFEIINASVSVDAYDIATYSSVNANAVLWYWQSYHSAAGAKIYNMTPLDGNNKSGTINVSNKDSTRPLLKVLFQGTYGRVAAQFLTQQ